MKAKCRFVICLSIFVTILFVKRTYAQESTTAYVNFTSSPQGASILLNSVEIGKTPYNQQLKFGTYMVRLSLPGFVDWTSTLVVQEPHAEVQAVLQGEPGLSQMQVAPTSMVNWLGNSDQLYFRTNDPSGNSTTFVYDLRQGSITKTSLPPDVIQNINIGKQPGIVGSSILSTAYRSPSGRYLAYASQNQPSTLFLYDTQLKSATNTTIVLFSDPFAPFDLIWSQSERVLSVRQTDQFGPHLINSIYLENNQTVRVLAPQHFQTNTGESLYTEELFISPSEQAMAIVRSDGRFWLVNLNAKTGTQIIQTIFGAAFSPDGAMLYLAQKEGIYRYKVNDLNHGEFVSNSISGRWTELYKVIFSPTLNYAIAVTSSYEAWLYQMPHS